MTDARTYPLADILSVTTGLLLSRRHMDGLYDLLGYMTGHDLFTHQLGRAADTCAPALLAQHPQLAEVRPPDGLDQADLIAWITEQERTHGEMLPVTPLSPSEPVDPIEELCDMVGPEKVVVLGGGREP